MKKSLIALAAAVTFTGIGINSVSAATYEVQEGDSLWSISQNEGTTVEQLKELNNLSSDVILPNQTLELDAPRAEEIYKVKAGDSLWKIANHYHVTIQQLKEWNQLHSDTIHPGQELTIQENHSEKETKQVQQKVEKKTEQVSTKKAEQVQANHEPEGKEMTVTATAYTASCNGCSGITATGLDLKKNPNQKVIAVDPKVIPLGSKVHVEGYGTAVAGDTGGAIKGNKIDLFIPSKADAIKFGVRTVKIKVLE
ncbi:LysM peptidoglycan-binding domain-containing protein [Lederbergia sp. NSJ-179]|uniref:3D domain-containing protein n=1 Tax=Lederbergia sp. NSJ-179 TaxID=2931402 RepID=UPI001FD5615A|nr:3D domain-containing protein [Lederbergia sp. NSJ-179]MCJ7841244.1 LysM peptidoglycan-binding domain-containing protein [Lederbergia sp. NSJ-179]